MIREYRHYWPGPAQGARQSFWLGLRMAPCDYRWQGLELGPGGLDLKKQEACRLGSEPRVAHGLGDSTLPW